MSSASRHRSLRSFASPRRGHPPAAPSSARPAAVLLGEIRLANDAAAILTPAAASAVSQALCFVLRRHGSLLGLRPALVRAVTSLFPPTARLSS